MILKDFQLTIKEQKEISQQRQNAKELNEFRKFYQNREDSREWDLNDPQRWKSLRAPRITDDDPRLGVSSAQIFQGEDLQVLSRKRDQQEQMKNYFHSQVS